MELSLLLHCAEFSAYYSANTTSGDMQLATLVQEFFVTNSILDPTSEERFQQFLSQKATKYRLL